MAITTSLLGAASLGAGLVYLLDPDRGRRRRALVRDRISSRALESESFLGKTGRDLRNRARGFVARKRSRVAPEGRVADDVLAERVRSELGRHVSHPGAIQVTANWGRVILQGSVLAHEVPGLISAVATVRGVLEIEDRLEVQGDVGDVPGLQGSGRSSGETGEFRQEDWSQAARFAAGTTAGLLFLLGMRRLGKLGVAATAVGAGLMARTLANKPVGRLTGVGVDPKSDMDEDLVRFKSLIEEGRTSSRGVTVTREDLRPGIE